MAGKQPEGDISDFEAQEELDELRRTNVRLMRQLARAKAKEEAMVAAAYAGAKDAVLLRGPIPPVVPPVKDRRRRSEWALWHLTDWQGAKLTTTYNSDVMRQRVGQFVTSALRLTEVQRADHAVKSCAILFGGDMIEGLFNFPGQPFEIDSTLFEQWANVSDLIAEVVRAALANFETVQVIGEWGNHGRIGSKRDVVPRSDNFDRMCYEHARRMLAGERRLRWEDSAEDIQRVELGNYRALLIHGDEVGRNGFASANTIVQHVNRWRSGAYPWPFKDVYIGHYHVHAEWPMANGEGSVFQTGSTESENRYARDNLASQAKPSQRVHFVDPDRGRVTAIYKVYLD